MLFHLYKIYSKNSLKENKLLKAACILSVTLAVIITIFAQIVLETYKKDIYTRIDTANGADIKIQDSDYLKNFFNQTQLDHLTNQHHLNTLNYTLSNCDDTNIIFQDTTDTVSAEIFNNGNILPKIGIKNLKTNEIAVSRNLAKRLNIKLGNKIYLKLHSQKYEDSYFTVSQIIDTSFVFSVSDTEYEFTQEILGQVFLILPDYEHFNHAYIDSTSTDQLSMLKQQFEPDFHVRTTDELKENVLPRIDLQINVIKLLATLALIISSICLIWSFMVFIMTRQKDFLIFKTIGLQMRDLQKLILIEILTLGVKGLFLGLPSGILCTLAYLRIANHIYNPDLLILTRSLIVTIVLVIVEILVFSLLPLLMLKNNTDIRSLTGNRNRLSVGGALFAAIIIIIVSSIYVKSGIGVSFFLVIGGLFAFFYLLLYGLFKIIGLFRKICKNKYYLSFYDLNEDAKINAFSLTIINLTAVVSLTLIIAIPLIFASADKNTAVTPNILYRTSNGQTGNSLLDKYGVAYEKYYSENVTIKQINDVSVEDLVKKSITGDYQAETVQQFKNRNLKVYDHLHMPKVLKKCEPGSIFLNNHYQNIADIQKGDQITIIKNNKDLVFTVAGSYEDAKAVQTIGYISDESVPREEPDPDNQTFVYTVKNKVTEKILSHILQSDPDAYIEKENNLAQYLETYIGNQKAVLVENIIAIGFSGLLLVILGQTILFVRKKEYYISLWKIGMNQHDLLSIKLLEKTICSVLQVVMISLVFEPIRFLIVSEFLSKPYVLSWRLLLAELAIALAINILSILIPIVWKRKNII